MKINQILIADDHELILTSISNILIEKFSVRKDNIFMFTDPQQVLSSIEKKTFDLYILDLEFHKISGFDLIEAIREKDKEAKIIVCTMHQEIWNVNRLLEMNVNGIILKNSTNNCLVQAVDSVSKGQFFLCPNFKEIKTKSQAYRRKGHKINILTKREQEVLQYIVEGYKSKDIADQLGISENAVENHRKNLFLKLDVDNVIKLVRAAIDYRLVEI